jgi:allantoicase
MKEAGGRRLFPGLLQETAAAHVAAKLTGIRMAGVFPDTGVGGLRLYCRPKRTAKAQDLSFLF